MTTTGIAAVYLTTRNWGAAARFMQSLGYTTDFTTDHNSGLFRSEQGPSVFIAEVPHAEPDTRLVLAVPDAEAVHLGADAEVLTEFEDTHFGTREMVVRDPDGRLWTLQTAPASASADPA